MFHKVLELGAGRADVVGHELKAQLQRERHAEGRSSKQCQFLADKTRLCYC